MLRGARAAPSTMRVAIRRFEAGRLSRPPDDVTDAVLKSNGCLPDPSSTAEGQRRLAGGDGVAPQR